MKGWAAVRIPSGLTFDLKFFQCDYSCGFAKIFCKNTQLLHKYAITMYCRHNWDIYGLFEQKGKINKNFETLFMCGVCVQK